MDFYDRTHAGRIMTRLTSDVNAVAELIQAGLTNFLVAIVTFSGMTIVLLVLNQQIVSYTEYWPLVLGAILVLLLFVFPGGIAGAVTDLARRLARGLRHA